MMNSAGSAAAAGGVGAGGDDLLSIESDIFSLTTLIGVPNVTALEVKERFLNQTAVISNPDDLKNPEQARAFLRKEELRRKIEEVIVRRGLRVMKAEDGRWTAQSERVYDMVSEGLLCYLRSLLEAFVLSVRETRYQRNVPSSSARPPLNLEVITSSVLCCFPHKGF